MKAHIEILQAVHQNFLWSVVCLRTNNIPVMRGIWGVMERDKGIMTSFALSLSISIYRRVSRRI